MTKKRAPWNELVLDPFDASENKRLLKEAFYQKDEKGEKSQSTKSDFDPEQDFENLQYFKHLRRAYSDHSDPLYFQRQSIWWDHYSGWGDRTFFYQLTEWHERRDVLINFKSVRHLYEMGARIMTDADFADVSARILADQREREKKTTRWWQGVLTL